MIFCDNCRVKNKWPRAAGFPYSGVKLNGKCEVCGTIGDSHDVPAIKLVPERDKTPEQKLVSRMMQDGFRDRAENLVIVHVSGHEAGKINHPLTEQLREIIVKNNGDIDWHATYELRVAAQKGIQRDEELKRDRRKYGL